jgi:hypothetical protein
MARRLARPGRRGDTSGWSRRAEQCRRHACRHREASGAEILRDGEGDNSELRGLSGGPPAGAVTAKMTAADEVR